MTFKKSFSREKYFLLKIRHLLVSLVSFMRTQGELGILWLFKKLSYTDFPNETLTDIIQSTYDEALSRSSPPNPDLLPWHFQTAIPKGHLYGWWLCPNIPSLKKKHFISAAGNIFLHTFLFDLWSHKSWV